MANKGKIQFTMIFSIPADLVGEGDRIFNSHAKWMRQTHHQSGEKALLIYDLSKTPEMENPMDPESGPTGNTLFIVSEVYETEAGLQDHWQKAMDSWDDFGALNELIGKCTFTLVNGAPIIHSLW